MSRPPNGTDAGGNIRVLVAEDDDPVRELLVDFLAREGYQVTGVSDGLQAVAELEAHSFDLVITDLFMPGLGGIDVLREARKIDPEYAVIVITGYPSRQTEVDVMTLGASGFLAKPFDLDAVRRKAALALRAPRRERRPETPPS